MSTALGLSEKERNFVEHWPGTKPGDLFHFVSVNLTLAQPSTSMELEGRQWWMLESTRTFLKKWTQEPLEGKFGDVFVSKGQSGSRVCPRRAGNRAMPNRTLGSSANSTDTSRVSWRCLPAIQHQNEPKVIRAKPVIGHCGQATYAPVCVPCSEHSTICD